MRKVGGVIKFNAICASILLSISTFYIINKTKLIHAGLKTVISELPPSSTALAASICKKITGRLTSAISKVGKSKINMEFFYCEVMTITSVYYLSKLVDVLSLLCPSCIVQCFW